MDMELGDSDMPDQQDYNPLQGHVSDKPKPEGHKEAAQERATYVPPHRQSLPSRRPPLLVATKVLLGLAVVTLAVGLLFGLSPVSIEADSSGTCGSPFASHADEWNRLGEQACNAALGTPRTVAFAFCMPGGGFSFLLGASR